MMKIDFDWNGCVKEKSALRKYAIDKIKIINEKILEKNKKPKKEEEKKPESPKKDLKKRPVIKKGSFTTVKIDSLFKSNDQLLKREIQSKNYELVENNEYFMNDNFN